MTSGDCTHSSETLFFPGLASPAPCSAECMIHSVSLSLPSPYHIIHLSPLFITYSFIAVASTVGPWCSIGCHSSGCSGAVLKSSGRLEVWSIIILQEAWQQAGRHSLGETTEYLSSFNWDSIECINSTAMNSFSISVCISSPRMLCVIYAIRKLYCQWKTNQPTNKQNSKILIPWFHAAAWGLMAVLT